MGIKNTRRELCDAEKLRKELANFEVPKQIRLDFCRVLTNFEGVGRN